MRWRPSLLGPSSRLLQTAFTSVPNRFVTPVTDSCGHLGTRSVVAFLQLELFRVYDYFLHQGKLTRF
ncbi:hypothetical protein CBW52_22350 [Yersinia kristensenii]|uniref:Secreted protein n=1 Tax=Yersinia kristensenii TaxID=28152 RepID=A0AB73NQZ3_YERKR|nr:hypothetical protein CBW52_22350 [Yersinia kristensenii]